MPFAILDLDQHAFQVSAGNAVDVAVVAPKRGTMRGFERVENRFVVEIPFAVVAHLVAISAVEKLAQEILKLAQVRKQHHV